MKPTREQILDDILGILRRVARDWEYEAPLTAETRLFEDLAFESLDLVVLGATIQEHFGQKFPFPEFFAEIGQRDVRDLTIGEWVEFIHRHVNERATAIIAEPAELAREQA